MKLIHFKPRLAVLFMLAASMGVSHSEASNYDETDVVSMGLKGPVAEVPCRGIYRKTAMGESRSLPKDK